MKKYILYPFRGIINLILLILATIFIAVSSYLVAILVILLPTKSLKHKGYGFLFRFPTYWIDTLTLPLWLATHKKWDIQGVPLNKTQPYLLISNHQSYIDILILGYVLHRKIPTIKFFAKRELLWTLPFAGLCMWIMGYPLLRRNSRKEAINRKAGINRDLAATHKACQQFITHPTTIVNFAEGTRFSQTKRHKKNSPYTHLLPPKVGGVATVVNEMKSHLGGIIDCTLVYDPSPLTFWRFLCGNFNKITCHYQLIPIDEQHLGDYAKDRQFRKNVQSWFNSLWQDKDARIDRIKKQ